MPQVESLLGTEILVTGAGGFVGRHTVAALANAGARVVALIGPPNSGLPIPATAAEAVEADICDGDSLRTFAATADIIVHLAGPPSVAASFSQARAYVRTHVEGTATLLDAIRGARTKRIVYVSSAEVYGQPACEFVTEDHRVHARSPYAACKIACEQLLRAHSRSSAVDFVILRPFSLYGPGASPESLINRVIRLARERQPIQLHDLKPVRDYCHIIDFACAVVRACLVTARLRPMEFNIGTMQGTSVRDIARLIVDALGIELVISENQTARRPGDSEIYRLVADNSRATAILGWKPNVSVDAGLRDLAIGAA